MTLSITCHVLPFAAQRIWDRALFASIVLEPIIHSRQRTRHLLLRRMKHCRRFVSLEVGVQLPIRTLEHSRADLLRGEGLLGDGLLDGRSEGLVFVHLQDLDGHFATPECMRNRRNMKRTSLASYPKVPARHLRPL